MVQLLIDDIDSPHFKAKIQIDDIEIQKGKMIPTYSLLHHYQQTYPQSQFHFIIGSDLLTDLLKWDQGLDLKNNCNFIIFERPLFNIN